MGPLQRKVRLGRSAAVGTSLLFIVLSRFDRSLIGWAGNNIAQIFPFETEAPRPRHLAGGGGKPRESIAGCNQNKPNFRR